MIADNVTYNMLNILNHKAYSIHYTLATYYAMVIINPRTVES